MRRAAAPRREKPAQGFRFADDRQAPALPLF
jgi:hypothetical protein